MRSFDRHNPICPTLFAATTIVPSELVASVSAGRLHPVETSLSACPSHVLTESTPFSSIKPVTAPLVENVAARKVFPPAVSKTISPLSADQIRLEPSL